MNGKWNRNTVLANYTIVNLAFKDWESAHNSCRQYEVKMSRIRNGHTRLTHGYLMTRNNQQPTFSNQILTIKHCLVECLQWRETRKNTISRVI